MLTFEEGDIMVIFYSENYCEIAYNIDNKQFKFLIPLEDINTVVI